MIEKSEILKQDPLNLEFFKKEGFIRKRCKICNEQFWTLNENADTCGDASCSKYEFLDEKIIKKASLSEIREKYLSFFERNGHERLGRYPVVARWREDIYFTIATIACFQPWVLNKEVEPPANPLVMSQPCLRFVDIDSVGRSGRHLTLFEMMAHHAFNFPENEIYWKDETVRLSFEWFKNLGIPEEYVNFKESWWEGGGNAGPCFEVCVKGLELATLVFMEYNGPFNGKYKKMDIRVVDTGYGLERHVWLAMRKLTVYDSIFPLASELKKKLGIEEDETFNEFARIAGNIKIEDIGDIRLLRKEVAKRLNITVEEAEQSIIPHECVYIICDHSKALCFMLTDGILPSNAKAGYFARLLARRMFRMLSILQASDMLEWIIKMQVDDLAKDFKEIKENEDEIIRILEVEKKKFDKTIRRGKQIVKKVEQKLLRENRREIPVETLIELYDTYGLSPEIVKEFSKLKVNIPSDFYARVSELHKAEASEEETAVDVSGLPRTQELFYDQIFEFKARILKKIDNYVVLDKTAFYPEGGGQPSDTGKIAGANVKRVVRVKGVILHEVDDASKLEEGQVVNCKVDVMRRVALTKAHTATHILVASARKVLGKHVWQAGAQKGVERSRLDVTHYELPSNEQLKEIERIANEIVQRNLKLRINWKNRNEAERKYGFIIYQGGVVPGKKIRIVEIPSVDVQACCGTHCRSTGDVGLIKIVKCERIQDGVIRFIFTSGESAIKYVQDVEEKLKEACNILRVEPETLPKTVRRFFKEWKTYRKENEKLKELLVEQYIKELQSEIGAKECIIREYELLGVRDLELLLKKIKDKVNLAILISKCGDKAFAICYGDKEFLKEVKGFALKNEIRCAEGREFMRCFGKFDKVASLKSLICSKC